MIAWYRRDKNDNSSEIKLKEFSNLSYCCCCCSIPQSCLARCGPMDCSTPGSSAFTISGRCPLSQQCYLIISFSVAPFSLSQNQGLSSELALGIRWLKYWSFSFIISPSNRYLGLISFRIDWFDLLAVQGTPPAPQFESIISFLLSLLYGLTLTSVCDCWKNYSLDYTNL